jgi:hypothetical protein
MLKIILEKSNIIKLSDISCVQILSFKKILFENIFSLNLNKNDKFVKLFYNIILLKNQLIIMETWFKQQWTFNIS